MEWFGHLVLIERSNSSYRVVLFEYCLRKSQTDNDTKGSMRYSRGQKPLKTQWMSGCLYVKATAWSNCCTVTSSEKYIRRHLSKVYFISTYYFCQRTITLICVFLYTGQSFTTNMVYTMGMEHGLTIFRPVIVRNILPDEWTRTSRRPYDPVYIN